MSGKLDNGHSAGDGNDALLSVPADTVGSLRAHVDRLHAERGEAVREAKRSREEQGFASAAFQLDWAHVESLTGAIAHYEAALERALEAGTTDGADGADVGGLPLLRDPAAEKPDADIDVVLALNENDEGRGVTTGCYNGGYGWYETQDGMTRGTVIRSGMVAGWCHHEEAAAALRAARREVRHG